MGARAGFVSATIAITFSTAAAQPDDGADPCDGGEVKEADEADKATESRVAPTPVVAPAGATPADAPAAIEETTVVESFTWRPFGYLRVQGAIVRNDPNVAFVGRDDGFELQNARIGVRGDLADRASFVISIDGAVDERDRVNDPDGTIRVGLRDAFADLHLGSIDVRAGRFDVVFDPEDLTDDTERAFVDRAVESRGVRPTEGWETDGLPPGRSVGVAVRRDPGTPPSGVAVGFEVAAQNGADEFASDNDNDLVAVSAAGFVRLPSAGHAMVAARWNPRTEGELPFRQDETDLEAAAGVAIPAGPVRLGAGLIYVRTLYDTTGGPSQNAYGGHAQAVVRVLRGRAPVDVGYRFAILEPSDLILTDRVIEHTAGAVVGWPAWHARGQINLTLAQEQADRGLSNDRIEAVLELAL
jgi:hypothetical protein